MRPRDRRGAYGVGSSSEAGGLDAEALEEENDNRIDDLGAKAKFLKQMTDSIRVEVESQHSLLDKVGNSMGNTRGLLGGAADRFKTVMEDRQQRKSVIIIVGILLAFFFLWIIVRR